MVMIGFARTARSTLLKPSQIVLTSKSHFGVNVNLDQDHNLAKENKH